MKVPFLVIDCIVFLCVLLLLSAIVFADSKKPCSSQRLPQLPNKVMKNKIKIPGKGFIGKERARIRKEQGRMPEFNRLILL